MEQITNGWDALIVVAFLAFLPLPCGLLSISNITMSKDYLLGFCTGATAMCLIAIIGVILI